MTYSCRVNKKENEIWKIFNLTLIIHSIKKSWLLGCLIIFLPLIPNKVRSFEGFNSEMEHLLRCAPRWTWTYSVRRMVPSKCSRFSTSNSLKENRCIWFTCLVGSVHDWVAPMQKWFGRQAWWIPTSTCWLESKGERKS